MNRFLVIITFYGSDSYRVRNLKAVIAQAKRVWEDVDVCLVEQNGNTDVDGVTYHHNVSIDGKLFHKTKLLNYAVQSHPDYTHYVMLDADSYIDAEVVDNIINHCDDAPLIFPYGTCAYLNEAQTRIKCRDGYGNISTKYNSNIPITRQAGLINCFSKAVYDRVHGFDEEFIGWGAEDDAFIFKIRRLCGREKRLSGGVVFHLWHKKSNTQDYLDSPIYKRNRAYCSLLRLMSDDEFNDYLDGKTTLAESNELYKDKYNLGQWIVIKMSEQFNMKIDSSIYFIRKDNPTLYDVLQEVMSEDGEDYVKRFIQSYVLSDEMSPEVRASYDEFIKDTGLVIE